jgi:hypothetical protein
VQADGVRVTVDKVHRTRILEVLVELPAAAAPAPAPAEPLP